ncbi:hypothetical protein COCC4DRAFT_130904, partial [Bipolaris maydis ATCC 48331]
INGTDPSELDLDSHQYHVELRFVAAVASISPRRAEFTTPITDQDHHRSSKVSGIEYRYSTTIIFCGGYGYRGAAWAAAIVGDVMG